MMTIRDIAYVRYSAPDLAAMEKFLLDFGLVTARRGDDALYMRGAGPQPFIHVTERGASGCLGFGLLAESEADLRRLAAATGNSVVASAEPGGGLAVSLRDPAGFRVDVVWGATPAPAIAPRALDPVNHVTATPRLGSGVRLRPGPSQVQRLGHLVLRVPNFAAAAAYYTETFGLRVADSYYAGEEANTVVAFLRAGLGERYTDHHTIALVETPQPGFDHAAFEVRDWDDLMMGHDHLVAGGYRHAWGVGRHIQGSQVFDYWRDPFGCKLEHWTDGDRINDAYPRGHRPLDPGELAQWGPPLPADFFS